MLAIASHFPSTTQLKWSLVTFGILAVGAVLIMQQAQVSQLRSELMAARNEVTLVESTESQTDDDKTADTAKKAKSTQASTSTARTDDQQTSVANSDKQPVAQKSSGTIATESEHPDGCNCPIHTPTSIVSTPVQQTTTPTTSSRQQSQPQQSQPQQSSGGLVPSLLGGASGLVGGLL